MELLDYLKNGLLEKIETSKKIISNLKGITKIINIKKFIEWKVRKTTYEDIVRYIDALQNCYPPFPETCVWEYDTVMYDFSPHKNINLYKIHNNENFKYCPYCSKKIEIR